MYLPYTNSTDILISGTFANWSYEELSYPKNQEMCDPILVNSIENATPL